MASEAAPDPLSSVRAANVFPGRARLRVDEIARVLSVSPQQLIKLLRSGQLIGVEIGSNGEPEPGNSKTPWGKWRVPVEEYEAFLERRRSDKG